MTEHGSFPFARGTGAGGAIGGATAAAVGTGAVIGGSMLAGAEAGEAIGVVGGPVGMAVGAAGGTLLGATIGLGTAAYQDIVGMQSTGYVLAEEEQIQYIYNDLHTYKKVLHTSEGDKDVSNYFVPKDGFPQDPDDPADTVEAA